MMTMPVMTISTKNLPKISGKPANTVAINKEIALGASLQEQKNKVLGSTTAFTNISAILGRSGYKKEKDNLSDVVLG